MGDKERATLLEATDAQRAAALKKEGNLIDSSGEDQLRLAKQMLEDQKKKLREQEEKAFQQNAYYE